MYVVSLIGQKGGSNKSTLSAHIAVAAHANGMATAIIDADPQATLRFWSQRRQGEAPPVLPETTPEFISTAVDRFRANGADLVVIDTPGKGESMAARAAQVSDLVLIPTRPSMSDMDAIPTTVDIVTRLNRPYSVILSDVDVTGSKVDAEMAAKAFEARGIATGWATGAPTIHHRKIFKTCFNDGRTAQEVDPQGKAALEVHLLFEWVSNQLNTKRN